VRANPALIAFLIAGFPLLRGNASVFAAEQQASALPVEDVLRVRSFANWSSVEVSPDDKWLAYVIEADKSAKPIGKETTRRSGVAGDEKGRDIWIVNTETGETRNLTGNTGDKWLPKWSPDGHLLAFLSDRDGGGSAELWMWDVEKNNFNKIVDSAIDPLASQMEWTADGRGIFITIKSDGKSTAEYKNKEIKSVSDDQRTSEEKEKSSTVRLYKSSASRTGDKEEDPKSDPFPLNPRGLQDLVRVDVAMRRVTVVAHAQSIKTYKGSPDGSHIAYTITKRFEKAGSQQILYDLVVATLPRMKERVVAVDIRLGFDGDFTWSPDGTAISYRPHGAEEKIRDCYIVTLRGGASRNITHLQPQEHTFAPLWESAPLWDKTGRYIYFDHDGALWRGSVSQARASQIARVPGHRIWPQLISQFNTLIWTVDGDRSTIIVAHDDVGKQDGFYKVDLTTGKNTKLIERGQCYTCVNSFRMLVPTHHAQQQIAYLAEDAEHGSDLWLSDVTFKNPKRLSNLNPQFDKYKLGSAQLINWLSDDGERLYGALLLPSRYQNGKRYPLVVGVYAGGLLSNYFDHFGLFTAGMNPQLLATRGYAVLLPDSPQHEGTPMVDVAKTVLPGVNRVIEMGIADPERLGVMGHSNGGYGTLALIVQTRRFKAAIDVDGMGDLIGDYSWMGKDGTAFGTSNLEHAQDALGGTPWQLRERYIENSPFYYLDRVETPLLIVHVTGDPVVPSFLGDQIFVALRRLGKEVEYAKYEGEAHGPSGFVNQVDHNNRMIAWFDKYLRARE